MHCTFLIGWSPCFFFRHFYWIFLSDFFHTDTHILSLSLSLLKKQQLWLIHIIREGLSKQTGRGFINNASIGRQSCRHERDFGRRCLFFRSLHVRCGFKGGRSASDGQNGRLGWINDGRKFRNTKHAQIGNGKGSTLVFVRSQFPITSASGQILDGTGNFRQPLGVGIKDNGSNETSGCGHGNTNVNGIGILDRVATCNQTAIHFGHISQGECGTTNDKIIDRDLDLVFAGQGFAEGQHSIQFDLETGIKVGYGLFGFCQATGNDLTHFGIGDIFGGTVRDNGFRYQIGQGQGSDGRRHGGSGNRGRCCSSRHGQGGEFVLCNALQDISLGNTSSLTRSRS
mmetsp:Transcript_19096/g.39507  ORF Transcript_19096/g.39507 Transcript_19096/m.39507 type:complete len:341 (-) Transcript_19096:70-1092(-)